MERLKWSVSLAAWIVFFICLYTFLQGNGVFQGKFENDAISFYFLAKGLFCSIALYLLVSILEHLSARK